jgi:hypothetical protein
MSALRVFFTATATACAAGENAAPVAVVSAVLSTASPAHSPNWVSLSARPCPMAGKVNSATAPRARIAAMA